MFGVLLASVSNETLDFEKHHRKTQSFGEKKRARSEKRRFWKEKASPNSEKDASRKKTQKIEYLMSHFFAAPGSKTDVKMDPEIWKNQSSTFFFSTKKNRNFQTQFFFAF